MTALEAIATLRSDPVRRTIPSGPFWLALGVLTQTVEATLALHTVAVAAGVMHYCEHDGFAWPCPTVKALGIAE